MNVFEWLARFSPVKNRYIAYCHQSIPDEDIRSLLLYAAFCILEEISYTRKDGQYLRWEARSGRS
jgi:hypothetical protein